MDKTGKILIQFNVKNGQYAIYNGSTWTISPLTWLNSFSKEKDMTTEDVYGDGERQLRLVNDKGFTGTLGLTAQDVDYNKALGFNKVLSNGLAEVQQLSVIEHAIYFETQYTGKDGVMKTKKTWVFGVEAQAPSETYDQNTENINQSTIEYPITIKGVNTLASGGATEYKDANGNVVKTFTLSKIPGDTGYDTFENTVPTPEMSA